MESRAGGDAGRLWCVVFLFVGVGFALGGGDAGVVRLLWQLAAAAGCWRVNASEPRFPGDVRVAARTREGVLEGVTALGEQEDDVGALFREG